MMTVRVFDGVPGSGKSAQFRHDIIGRGGLNIIALPTIHLIDEQESAFRAKFKGVITRFDSASPGRGPMATRLLNFRRDLEAPGTSEPVAIFITHETMMMADLSDFKGWSIWIDEVPNSVTSGKLSVATSWSTFASHFELDPVAETDWSTVRAKGALPNFKAIDRDSLARQEGAFFKQAKRPGGLFVKAHSWEQARDNSLDWFSVWTPVSLESFDSVTFAGAGFFRSLGYKVATKWFADQIAFERVPVGGPRTGSPTVYIRYFTQGHEGTTTFWKSSKGRKNLVAVSNYLAQHAPDLGFWSGNDPVVAAMEHRIRGVVAKPKAAGLNLYRDHTSCAFIYSSKAVQNDGVLEDEFGITPDDIRIAREDEDIIQFISRGALRNPSYNGDYEIYLYSKHQADRLAAYLEGSGLSTNVHIVPIEAAGILDVRRPKGTSSDLPPEVVQGKIEKKRAAATARQTKRRARLKAEKVRDGTLRRAGRPKASG